MLLVAMKFEAIHSTMAVVVAEHYPQVAIILSCSRILDFRMSPYQVVVVAPTNHPN